MGTLLVRTNSLDDPNGPRVERVDADRLLVNYREGRRRTGGRIPGIGAFVEGTGEADIRKLVLREALDHEPRYEGEKPRHIIDVTPRNVPKVVREPDPSATYMLEVNALDMQIENLERELGALKRTRRLKLAEAFVYGIGVHPSELTVKAARSETLS
jgi:hypothetical protein